MGDDDDDDDDFMSWMNSGMPCEISRSGHGSDQTRSGRLALGGSAFACRFFQECGFQNVPN